MIKLILQILSAKEKKKLVLISILILIGMLFEMLSLGVVIPVIILLLKGKESFLQLDFFSQYKLYLTNISSNDLLLFCLLLIFIIFIIKYFFLVLLYFSQYNFAFEVTNRIASDIMNNYFKRPYVHFLKSNSSKMLNNIINQINIFISQGLEPLLLIFSEIFIFFGIVSFLIFLEPKVITVAILAISIPSFLILLIYKNKIKSWGIIQQLYNEKILKNLQESFHGIKEIKIFRKENLFLSTFINYIRISTRARKNMIITNNLPRIFLEANSIIFFIFFIFFFVDIKSSSEIISFLAVFTLALYRLLPSLNRIMQALQSLRYGYAATKVIKDEITQKTVSNKNFLTKSVSSNFVFEQIEFSEVSFCYEKDNFIFKNLNFEIIKNDFIGIVGKTGSGKSTFIDIFVGLLPIVYGKIIINKNLILSDIQENEWLDKIGYVPQNCNFLDSDIENNITFQKEEEIDYEHLQFCIKCAELDNFIFSLPQKLKTKIGERGVMISGGQKQRISLARSLYKKPKILILDESTSGLDFQTEEKIMQNLKKLDITIIIVTHRNKLLSYCNKILNFNELKL